MSSFRVAFGAGLSTAVKSSGKQGLVRSSPAQKCWLSSYTLSKQFHSFHHFQSTFPRVLVANESGNVFDKNQERRRDNFQPYYLSTAGIHSSAPKCRVEARIDESLNRLDIEIRRVGRIRRQEVDDIFDDIKEMKKATSSQSLMIIRCCGELIPEEPLHSRTELVQQIWKTLESLKVPMDVSHYNALLRVYLENEHKFNPTEFLQDLTSKGIEPNRVTYQRLISRYCQDGDIDGASTILQYMKEQQMPINENVFNALILGHGQSNDMESAEGILGVMKQAGIEPNDDTYVTLMTCYAKHGDISNVHRIAKECESKEIFLIDRDFLNVIFALATNNQPQLVDEILPYLKKHSGFNQEATSIILRLVNSGQEEIAFKILSQMLPMRREDGRVPSGNFFIKHLIQLGRPSEMIIKYCKMLQDQDLNKFALLRACEFALMAKSFELAMELFETLQQAEFPIRQHYFWPFFATASSQQDIYFGLRCMRDLGLTPSADTLRDYVIPNLLEKQTEPTERTLQHLSKATKIPLDNIVSSAMLHLLSGNQLKLAADFATQYRLRFAHPFLRRTVISSYRRTNDIESFTRIIGSSCLDGDDSAREDVGMMLLELIDAFREPEKKAAALEPVLKQLLANGLGLSNSGSDLLQNNLGEALTPELATTISQLTSSELTPKITLPDAAARSMGGSAPGGTDEKSSQELEHMLAEAIKRNNPTKMIKKALLYSYCRDRNLEKLEKLKAELEQDEFVFTPGLQAMFMDLYALNGKLEEAKACYEEVRKSLEMKMDDIKILRYAAVLQAGDDLEGCLEVLKTAPRNESHKATGGAQQVAVWKLLNSVAEISPEKVKEVFNVLNDRKLMAVNTVTLGPLVKAYLTKDDLEGALKEFERCVNEYRVTPWKQELFCRFIKTEDAERLQKVMDLSTLIHGEVNSMYDLVFAFIDCGKLRQAKKILDTPGLRTRNDKIERYCQRYCQENRVAELENLIQVTKDLLDVDRSSMYFYLLQAYCKLGDPDKALSVWTSMQEENVHPSVELLIYLANFLQKNNRPVPFVIPDASELEGNSDNFISSPSKPQKSEDAPSTTTVTLPRSITEFRRCIDMNDIDRALQILQRMEADGSTLSFTDTTNLIQRLARAERLNEATRLTDQLLDEGRYPLPSTLKFLVGRLANAGDINALERLDEKLSLELKRQVMLNSRRCLAYNNANRGPEYFENFIVKTVMNAVGVSNAGEDAAEVSGGDAAAETGNIPVSGAITLLSRNEHLLPKYEDLIVHAQGIHRRALNNSLYGYFMLKKEYSRATEIWNNTLKSEPRILFRTLSLEARRNKDSQLARNLASHVMGAEQLAAPAKAIACSCVLDVLGGNGEISEALNFLDESLKTIQLEDYPVSVLGRLKELADAAGKKFPHQIPESRNRRARKRADSSDSDSD